MALARTNQLQQNSAGSFGTGTFTTNSFNLNAGSLAVAAVFGITLSDLGMDGDNLTLAGGSVTWTSRIATVSSPNWSYGLRVWTGPVAAGGSRTVDIDCGAENIDAYRVEIMDFSGYNVASPVGGVALGEDADGNGAASITLDAAPALGDITLGFAADVLNANTDTSISPGSGFSTLFQGDLSTSFFWTHSMERLNSTSTSVPWAELDVTGGVSDGSVLGALVIRVSQFVEKARADRRFFMRGVRR